MYLHHLTSFPNGDYYYEDKLVCKFKVVDLNTNQILYNDLNVTNFDDYKIRLIGYNSSFLFHDDEAHCNNMVEFRLDKNPLNPNEVTYTDFSYGEYIYHDCPYGINDTIPMFLPTVDLVLTRQ